MYRNDAAYERVCQLFAGRYAKPDNTVDLSQVKGRCLQFHVEMSNAMRQVFNLNSVLTIGYVTYHGQDFYKFDSISSKLTRVQADGKHVIDIHVWLTLPSYEIIDFTLLAHMAYIHSSPEKKERLKSATDFPYYFGSAAFLHSDEGVAYHPRYVGEDVLRKNGFITATP